MQELRWKDFEYLNHEKSIDWYWGLGVVTILGVGLSIFFDNTLLAILIGMGGIAIGLFAMREPKEIEYIIGERTIILGDETHPYNELESFSIDHQHHDVKLIIVSKKFFLPYIVITIKEHHPDTVREYLVRKLPEGAHQEPIIHAIAERIGI
mgnify:CR=1 FL=1